MNILLIKRDFVKFVRKPCFKDAMRCCHPESYIINKNSVPVKLTSFIINSFAGNIMTMQITENHNHKWWIL